MKQQIAIIYFFLSMISGTIYAQNVRFIHSGVIEFEKSINSHAILKKQTNKDNESYMRTAFEEYKKTGHSLRF